MPELHSPAGALWALQALVSAFLAILFLQSGIDKIVDRKGNLAWLTGYFAKSPLASTVSPMLTVITILEVAAGVLSAIGSALVLIARDSTVAFYGSLLAAVALTALFFGQRISRDYAGAAALVPYFLLVLAAIHILSRA